MRVVTMVCEECGIGRCQPTLAPYLHRLENGQLMMIPDAPASACDVCGEIRFDDDFASKIRYLLDHLDHKAQSDTRGRPLTPTDLSGRQWGESAGNYKRVKRKT